MAEHPKLSPARHKSSTDVSCVLVMLLSLVGISPAISAPEPTAGQVRPFLLRAAVDQMPQLSRNELAGYTPPAAPIYLPPGNVPVTTNTNEAAASNGQVKEYNVDWSSWVSQLADRWFFALRSMEESSGIKFFTPRAALIQFTCYANGQVGNICLRQSCGVPAYDRLQVYALLAVTPLPPFPTGTKRTSMTLIEGWDAHPVATAGDDYQPGSFGKKFPKEKVQSWVGN